MYSNNSPSQSFDQNFSAPTDLFAAAAAADERAGFIIKTYAYLCGAIAALIAIETFFFTVLGMENMMKVTAMMFGGQFSWLIVFGAFMLVSWVANGWAQRGCLTIRH